MRQKLVPRCLERRREKKDAENIQLGADRVGPRPTNIVVISANRPVSGLTVATPTRAVSYSPSEESQGISLQNYGAGSGAAAVGESRYDDESPILPSDRHGAPRIGQAF
jgi:hypothetical protein